MALFSAIKIDVLSNINDATNATVSNADLEAALSAAYQDIACRTQCIIKKTSVNWVASLSYYDFVTLGIPDYLATVAIFNNVNNQWLADDCTLREFDRFRDDWEICIGSPTHWAAINYKYTAIYPKYSSAPGTFDIYYWATAPALNTASTPLISTDFQNLLTEYATADLLEQIEEISKAKIFFNSYTEKIENYRDRTKLLSKADLITRI